MVPGRWLLASLWHRLISTAPFRAHDTDVVARVTLSLQPIPIFVFRSSFWPSTLVLARALDPEARVGFVLAEAVVVRGRSLFAPVSCGKYILRNTTSYNNMAKATCSVSSTLRQGRHRKNRFIAAVGLGRVSAQPLGPHQRVRLHARNAQDHVNRHTGQIYGSVERVSGNPVIARLSMSAIDILLY